MMVALRAWSTPSPSRMGFVGSGPQAGVCSASASSPSLWLSSWCLWWDGLKMELLQGWMPAVEKTVPAVCVVEC
jgi:hypothetical protein